MSADWLSPAINALNSATNANLTAAYDTWNVLKATTQNAGVNWKVTLPAPALSSGKIQFVAVEVDPASTQGITLVGNAGTENIGPGTATSRVMWAGESAILYTDGTNWFKVAGLSLPMSASFTRAAAQSIPTNTITKVLLDTQIFSYGLLADLANSRFTVQRPARFICTSFCRFDGTFTETDVLVFQNGSEIARCCGVNGNANNQGICVTTADCAAGDHLELDVYNSAGFNTATSIPPKLTVTEQPNW